MLDLLLAGAAPTSPFPWDLPEGLKALIDYLTRPEIFISGTTILFFLSCKFYRQWTKPKVAMGILVGSIVFLFASMGDGDFWKIISKPDNVPIAGMLAHAEAVGELRQWCVRALATSHLVTVAARLRRELGLAEPLLRAIEACGYTTPTPIQEQAIPPLLADRDLLGCAQTGTGKTAAFTLPMISILAQGRARARMPRSLVLCPTRELAAQIDESFQAYGRFLDLRHAVIFGGVSERPQIDTLRKGIDVLVATPGRLLDLQGRGFIDLSGVDFFVLDEAQQLTPLEAKTVITRMSKHSKIVLIGDPAQIDNPYVDSRSNGLVYTRDRLKDQAVSAHVSLSKGERSSLAELGATLM